MGADVTVMVEPRIELGTCTEDALQRVYATEYPSLVRLARLLVDRREEAEDVVQEAFARTWAKLSSVREPDPLPYVRRAVVNLARGRLRRRRTAAAHPAEPARDVESAEAGVLREAGAQQLLERLRRLPGRQRECVVLRYYQELGVAEIAATLGVAEGSVKSHLHRAITTLGVELEDPR